MLTMATLGDNLIRRNRFRAAPHLGGFESPLETSSYQTMRAKIIKDKIKGKKKWRN